MPVSGVVVGGGGGEVVEVTTVVARGGRRRAAATWRQGRWWLDPTSDAAVWSSFAKATVESERRDARCTEGTERATCHAVAGEQ